MRKNNEGYALPFVLVVSIVMCLIAVTVMSFSLKNLQVQQASIEKMQAKYEAAAEIEKVIAMLQKADETITESGTLEFEIPQKADGTCENVLKIKVSDKNQRVWIIAEYVPSEKNGELTITFEDKEQGVLTVGNVVGLTCRRYEVVSKETADEFIESETDPGEVGNQ